MADGLVPLRLILQMKDGMCNCCGVSNKIFYCEMIAVNASVHNYLETFLNIASTEVG